MGKLYQIDEINTRGFTPVGLADGIEELLRGARLQHLGIDRGRQLCERA